MLALCNVNSAYIKFIVLSRTKATIIIIVIIDWTSRYSNINIIY